MPTWTYLLDGRRLEVHDSMWGKLSVRLDGTVTVQPRRFLGFRRTLEFTSREAGRDVRWRIVFEGIGYLRMPTRIERDGMVHFSYRGRS